VLKEFLDVFSFELLDVLPLMRGIQNIVDLVCGATLPNLPYYRISFSDHVELQRQVYKLLQKRFIQESLSSCATPSPLTRKKDGSWRMCMDSLTINRTIITYHFPIS